MRVRRLFSGPLPFRPVHGFNFITNFPVALHIVTSRIYEVFVPIVGLGIAPIFNSEETYRTSKIEVLEYCTYF